MFPYFNDGGLHSLIVVQPGSVGATVVSDGVARAPGPTVWIAGPFPLLPQDPGPGVSSTHG